MRVSVGAKIDPTRLPRTGSAPVSFSLSGHIAPTSRGSLPKLQQIQIAINSQGALRLRGLPVCRLGHIDPSTSSEALLECRRSLIGGGRFTANVKIAEQSPFPSIGKVFLFNGRLRGKPAILAHVYGTRPTPTSYVLPFLIDNLHGTYGTELTASLPGATGKWGYVTGLSLHLDHRFLRAGCPAPSGVPIASFPLVRTRFSFAGGVKVATVVNRTCRPRG